MANYSVSRSGIATGTSLIAVMEIFTPALGPSAKVYHWWIDFDGVSASATPVLVELTRSTPTAGATRLTATTIVSTQISTEGPATGLVLAVHTATAGSSSNLGDTVVKRKVPPTTGFDMYLPDNRLIVIGAAASLRMNVTAAATVNATVGFEWEE